MDSTIGCMRFHISGMLLYQIECDSSAAKVFGERLGKYVSVRKAVGVNSTSIHGIRKILDKPGLSFPKVAILCGGPDWPTSVLTGILKLSLLKCIVGSLPVVLVTPTVMAGALQLKRARRDIRFPGKSILGLAAGTQMAGLFAATYFVEDVRAKFYDELAADPDEEVLALEKEEAIKMRERMELRGGLFFPFGCELCSFLARCLQLLYVPVRLLWIQVLRNV